MKITMTVTLPADNEIQFYDACIATAEKLRELGRTALRDGDHEQFRGTRHDVVIERGSDEPEPIGVIKVSK